MGRPCGPCGSDRRKEIDRRLLEMDLNGETYHSISQEFSLSEYSLRRHKMNHLSVDVSEIRQAMESARAKALAEVSKKELEEVKDAATTTTAGRLEMASNFLDQLKVVRERAASLLDEADDSGDLRAAGQFLKELREQIRLWAELEGRLAAQTQINLQQNNVSLYDSEEWLKVGDILHKALEPYPEAQGAAAMALLDLVRSERT